MSLSPDLMVKVEAEDDKEWSGEPGDSYEECQVKVEPAEEPQNQEPYAVNDPLTSETSDPLILASFKEDPIKPESQKSQPCRICGRSLKYGFADIGERGLLTLQRASARYQDGKFPPIQEKVQLHAVCRGRYTTEWNIIKAERRLAKLATLKSSESEEKLLNENEDGSEYREQSVSSDVMDVSGSDFMETQSSVSETSGLESKGNEYCLICGTSNAGLVSIGHKAVATLIRSSEERRDNKVPPSTVAPVRVHSDCRSKYNNYKMILGHVRRLMKSEVDPSKPRPEGFKGFDYRERCLICAGDASEAYIIRDRSLPERDRNSVRRVRREAGEGLYRASFDHPGPDSEEVRKRIKGKDLVVLQARYHDSCYKQFCFRLESREDRAKRNTWEEGKKGRRPCERNQAKFDLMCDYIENNWDDSQFLVEDIRRAAGTETNIEFKLPDRYGISFRKHSSLVVTPGVTVSDDWYEQKLSDEQNERLRIVRMAANIILEDIRSIPFDNKSYPPPSAFLDDVSNVIPETLKTFVGTVVTKYKKDPESGSSTVTALSHSIMTAARPKTFKSPLLLGLGSYINQNRSPKSVIELLSSVGFCASYKDITQFEVSAAYKPCKQATKSEFTQFAFDVVNTEINGHRSQALVGVECVTPRTPDSKIVRREEITTKQADWWCSKISLETYDFGTSGLKNIPIEDHRDETVVLPTNGDALWLFGRSDPSLNLPGWDAFMSKMPKDKENPLSEIRPLPVIYAPASYDTVYSALKHAKIGSKGCVCVTFDQPLYQIAQDIVNSDASMINIVLRLGGFHVMLSYLGAVGYIMSGSGLEHLWCGIYAPEQIGKMMTGHAFARAVRAHFLTRSALFNIITKNFHLTPEEKLEIEGILDGITQDNPGVKRYQEPLAITLELLEKRGPTAQLWVQYFRMTTLMAKFIEAERTANWELHLSTLKQMLPHFHASGHFEYAKSCSLYLQDMQKLESKMSAEEFEKFTKKGYFAVRRTDKLWDDVWSDLIVEQTMARLMKRPDGVTNGRRVTDDVLGHWTDAGPTLCEVADLVEGYCRNHEYLAYTDEAIRQKDIQDIGKLQTWFEEHNPFMEMENLMSLGTGVVGGGEVRCHEAVEVGKRMMTQNVGQNYHDVTYSREKCVLPLSSITSAIQIENFKVPVESDTILKRIHITKENKEEIKTYFDYELAPYPLSLFNDQGMIEGKKSELFRAFIPVEIPQAGSRSHVIDGEFLLHKVSWGEGADIMTIINSYVEYVKTNFTNPVVVFGGRKRPIFKRNKVKCPIPALEFQIDTVITISQDNFLSNEKNRDKLIQYLLIDFTHSGISVKMSHNDVEAYIVQTANADAETYEETCVVSDNPDLLVIMTALAAKNIYFMKPGRGKKPSTYYHVEGFESNKTKLSILFIHAVCGHDSTSSMFWKSRIHADLTICSIHFRDVRDMMSVFKNPNADRDSIAEAGYNFMRHLYHDKGDNFPVDDLNVVRFEKFAEIVTKNKRQLAILPPTKEAVRQHMYRTYHQIQKWLGNDLPATDWGWKLVGDRLEPITTLAESVPRELLDMISCRCDSICTGECACRRMSLDCCVLCVNCNGKACHGVDMDQDAFEEGYRVLSGCDALGDPVEHECDNLDDCSDTNDNNDDDEPKRPKRARRETLPKENKPSVVEQVYIVECPDQDTSDYTPGPTEGQGRATRSRASLSH